MATNKKVLMIGVFSAGGLSLSYASAYERLGYEVIRFDYDDAYFNGGKFAGNRLLRRTFRRVLWNRMNRRTREVALTVRPVLILAIKSPYLDPETIRDLCSLGAPVVNYYPDNPYCGVPWDPRKTSAQRYDLIDALREYSRVWIWQPDLAAKLARDKVCAGYLPFASDPKMYYPHKDQDSEECLECHSGHKVVLIGQHSIKRQAHVAAIYKNSVDLWGARWARAGAKFADRHRIHRTAAFGSRTSMLYSQASVSLNVVDDLNMPGHNMRTFEIPASGGLMLGCYTREQAEFFPENEAAVYYRSPEELDTKIDWLLGDDMLRKQIRGNALRIAASQTYDHRAAEMLRECGLSVPVLANSRLNNSRGLTS
jgi:spore maturation protein CgeB